MIVTVSQSLKLHLQMSKIRAVVFTMSNGEKKQKVLTAQKLEPSDVWHFFLKNNSLINHN